MLPQSEHGHAHHHGTGVRWLDMVMAVSAVLISVVSLYVSIEHGKTMEKMVDQNEKMVAANTLPYLTLNSTQLEPVTSKPELRFSIKNGGVGPALVDHFEVRYKGVAYSDPAQLLRACCADALRAKGTQAGLSYSNVSNSIIPARETVDFLRFKPEGDDSMYQSLIDAQKDLSLSACYCSVLEQCWQTGFEAERPKPVKECHTPKDAKLW